MLTEIFTAPFSGLFAIFEKIYEAAEAEKTQERENIVKELSALYRALEMQEISEEEFEQREKILMNKLKEIEKIK